MDCSVLRVFVFTTVGVKQVCHWHTAPHNPARNSYIVKLTLHFYAQEDFFMNKKTEQELVSPYQNLSEKILGERLFLYS